MSKTILGALCSLLWALGITVANAGDTLPLAPGTAVVNGNASGQTPRVSVNLDSAPASFIQNADGTPTLPAPTDANESSSSGAAPPPAPAKPRP
jgi:hypothetical protein